jgi:hypothetical protein
MIQSVKEGELAGVNLTFTPRYNPGLTITGISKERTGVQLGPLASDRASSWPRR